MLIWGDFSRHNLIKIYTKSHQTAPYFQNFLGYHYMPPSICVQLYYYYFYIKIAFLFYRFISKYTPKRNNCNMFSKFSS